MKFWDVKNQEGGSGEITLYGEISNYDSSWWDGGQYITSKKFLEEIEPLKLKSEITVKINSGGGDLFIGLQIATVLKGLSAKKTCIIEGLSASAATIIASACDTVKIYGNGMYMVHKPKAGIFDFVDDVDVEKASNLLRACKESLVVTYIEKTGRSREEVTDAIDNEKWFVGQEAVDFGFCDEVIGKDIPMEFTNSKFVIVNHVAHNLNGCNQYGVLQQKIQNLGVQREQKEGANKIMNLKELKEKYPDIYNQAVTEAEQKERKRIQDIDAVSACISPELVAKAKYEEPLQAKDLCFMAMKEGQVAAGTFMNNLKQDKQESGVEGVSGNALEEPGAGKEEQKKLFLNALNKDKRRTR